MVRNESLRRMTRITIEALIVIDVHARDVVEALSKIRVKNENDFNWVSQLRYYWENEAINVSV